MRALVYSDFHIFHNWPEFNQIQSNGLPRFLNKQLELIPELDRVAQENGCHYKLFCGDLIHRRSFIHTTTAIHLLDAYRKIKVPEIMIGGNHDRYDQTHNAINLLRGIPLITILGSGNDSAKSYGNTCFYSLDPGAAVYPITKTSGKHILLAHGSPCGAKTATGFEITSGYNRTDFEQFDLVCIGDIHKSQILGNILIPGNVINTNWGEYENVSGVWLVDTDGKFESGTFTTVNGIALKFVPITTTPKWIVVKANNFEEVLVKAEEDPTQSENHYDFRLVQAFTRAEMGQIQALLPYSLFRTPKSEKTAVATKTTLTNTGTLTDLLRQYAVLKQINYPDEFIATANQFLTECLPKNVVTGGAKVDFLWMKAENFMAFKTLEFSFEDLDPGVYLVRGKTEGSQSTLTNAAAKSTFAVEVITFTIYGTLARSNRRSKDGLIHNPGGGELSKDVGLFTEVGIKLNDQDTYILQRYRKHPELGTGCRVLKKECFE